MNLDVSNVQYSNYDLSHKINIPTKLTRELSYFSGIHWGDGHLGNPKKYYYSLEYAGHLIDESIFYRIFFVKLFKKLFNKNLRIYEIYRDSGDFLKLSTQSKGIFTFLSTSLNFPVGPKVNHLISSIILEPRFLNDFIRGLADSDFCLTFKERKNTYHSYPVISFNSSSFSLVSQINEKLLELNFKTSTLFNFPKKRYEKTHISNQLEISGEYMLEKWMKTISFNSRKHLTKYLVWKKFGFCPTHTNLPQRELILKGDLDPYSFYKSFPKSL
ncbi:hypothetical protein J4216_01940 [Candidatus Woesearchaeota archaeon]|nr:hypothetical protein [Candidatus Woesearchaeota archaeon]